MQNSKSIKKKLITLAHILPLITSVILWAQMLIPHLYFVYEGKAQKTMSPFGLMSNAWEYCQSAIKNGVDTTGFDVNIFSRRVTIFIVLIWAALILHFIVSLLLTITSVSAFSNEPTSKQANVAKRVLHLICPNRVCLVTCNLLPIVPALFPYVLENTYRSLLLIEMKAFFVGPSQLWIMIPLILLCEILFLSLIPAQRDLHMDMFRLYKKK